LERVASRVPRVHGRSERLKGKICNKESQMVCCTENTRTTATTTTTTTSTTTTTKVARTLKRLTGSSNSCQTGNVCQPMSQCPSIIRERNQWKQLEKGSAEYNTALNNLRAKICNPQAKTFCCPRNFS